MESARCKEQHSTCPQSVWDATTVDIHHEAKVPNTWWAAEDTQPCVHNFHAPQSYAQPAAGNHLTSLHQHTNVCSSDVLSATAKLKVATTEVSKTHTAALLACASHRHSKKLHLTQLRLTQPDALCRKPQTSTNHDLCVMLPPWFALVDNKLPTGLGIWSQHGARSNTQLARSPSGTPPLWTYTIKPRCPTHGGLLRIRSHASTTSTLRKAMPSQQPLTN